MRLTTLSARREVTLNITVTGASGFLGAWAIRALIADQHRVRAVVRDAGAWRLRGVGGLDLVEAPPEEWPRFVGAYPVDVLMLLDWSGVDAASRQAAAVQNANVDRWCAVTRSGIRAGAARIVGLGSQAEFGPRSDIMGDDDEPAPVTAYGRAKVAARRMLERECTPTGMRAVWARVFSVYGPLDNPGTLLPGIIDAAAARRPHALGSGVQRWSYLYAADAARALALLAAHPNPPAVANVAHPEAPALRQVVERFADGISDARLAFGARADDPGSPELRASVRALAALGWVPRVELDEGLARTREWLLGLDVTDPFAPDVVLPGRSER